MNPLPLSNSAAGGRSFCIVEEFDPNGAAAPVQRHKLKRDGDSAPAAAGEGDISTHGL